MASESELRRDLPLEGASDSNHEKEIISVTGKLYHPWKNLLLKFDRWWKKRKVYHSWKNLLYVLDLCRFSILMVLAGWLLLYSAQGQDMLLGIAGAPRWNLFSFLHLPNKDQILFLLSLLLWAWSIWFFARIMLYFEFPEAPQEPLEVENKTESAPLLPLHSLRHGIPWVLLVIALSIPGCNLFTAAQGIDQDLREYVFSLVRFTIGVGVVFFWIVWVWVHRNYSSKCRKRLPDPVQQLVPEPRKIDDLIKCECELTLYQRASFWIFVILVCPLAVGVGAWLAPSPIKKYFLILDFSEIIIL